MESLQLRVEVVAGGKHDGMGAMRLFDEEVAVSQKNLHRHKIVHKTFGCIRLKFTECTEDADLYHRNDILQQSLETQGCQRIVIYNGEFGHRLACHCFLHFFVHHIADISVICLQEWGEELCRKPSLESLPSGAPLSPVLLVEQETVFLLPVEETVELVSSA